MATDTTGAAPSDDELVNLLCNHWPAFAMQAVLVRIWVRAAVREAIAKLGAQPAVAGEPLAWQYQGRDGLSSWFLNGVQYTEREYNSIVAQLGTANDQ